LRSDDYGDYMRHMYGDSPRRWQDDLRGLDRLRFITNCLTRLRYCTIDGSLEFSVKGALGSQRADLLPWFRVPGRRWQGERILFGHWGLLGVHREAGVYGLDSGCVHRGRLTALRLDGELDYVSVACVGGRVRVRNRQE
jgi:bis(5'-nucleosyl)-tetraphosphatase (symmetrical)